MPKDPTQAVIEALTPIVDATVKAYRSDFDEHDMALFAMYPGQRFLWSVRDTGTYTAVLSPRGKHFAQTIVEHYQEQAAWYLLDFQAGTVTPLTVAQARQHVADLDDPIFEVHEGSEGDSFLAYRGSDPDRARGAYEHADPRKARRLVETLTHEVILSAQPAQQRAAA